jgi:hypothetical protein
MWHCEHPVGADTAGGAYASSHSHRRGRANLRPPSRSACVIDRPLKNQNPLENVIIFDHPRRAWSWADVGEPRRNFAVGNSWTREPCSVRAFDVSTARRSAAASRGPRPDGSRAGWRLRQSHHLALALSSTGDDSRPHHAVLDRKIGARLFRRVRRLVEARIIPGSYFPSNGFCLYGDRITTNCGPRWRPQIGVG